MPQGKNRQQWMRKKGENIEQEGKKKTNTKKW
jgi:hypothetical protein